MFTEGKYRLPAEMNKEFEWQKWMNLIPPINFKPDWQVTIIPPLIGAIVRFKVSTDKIQNISVYLDCYDLLGFHGSPYWEVYHEIDPEGPSRFPMEDIEPMTAYIQELIDRAT